MYVCMYDCMYVCIYIYLSISFIPSLSHAHTYPLTQLLHRASRLSSLSPSLSFWARPLTTSPVPPPPTHRHSYSFLNGQQNKRKINCLRSRVWVHFCVCFFFSFVALIIEYIVLCHHVALCPSFVALTLHELSFFSVPPRCLSHSAPMDSVREDQYTVNLFLINIQWNQNTSVLQRIKLIF